MIPVGEVHILDLDFLEESASIASFLIESNDGLILVESGPETTFQHLKEALAFKGFDWKEIKHVLLTHIHFDHAGAAWKFADNGAKIYVHPIGLPHLQNPEKLWNSAKMIYQDEMDRLWGNMEPIAEELLIPADDGDVFTIGDVEIKVHYTPGHAVHHNAYQLGDILFTGDVGGVRIGDGPVVPPCPPPDINIELWKNSIDKIQKIAPTALYMTHFGRIENVPTHLEELKNILDDWANWMKPHFDAGTSPEEITPDFMKYTKKQLMEAGVTEENLVKYEYANPSWMSVSGLLRYWKLKEQGRI
jgi:glyoxylase-like metal-dependent hydrolase (beta-lactamase superfamily II)